MSPLGDAGIALPLTLFSTRPSRNRRKYLGARHLFCSSPGNNHMTPRNLDLSLKRQLAIRLPAGASYATGDCLDVLPMNPGDTGVRGPCAVSTLMGCCIVHYEESPVAEGPVGVSVSVGRVELPRRTGAARKKEMRRL
ncbi:hypothetical protein SODALDRAFT_327208 [Sodiomyces alkalinus F11]|uniref:Uncharacterized protein n=1 Tax=Sodiomyces alkalinus (strain CBS 110278 / VKM F-3762 / F11) TaxID=1314773 RepID=A0A3N2Q8D8_SODAK|nr:hypothetical protein SODALDRAFT_327208 [Sodiomyces alkalinus F11]ROT43039.1 hypothetical protein SODALDRAFT_327208 [Sodiomyces alkalinus F11]